MSRKRKGSSPSVARLPGAAAPERRKASSRSAQVAEAVRQAIGSMLTDGSIKDPRLEADLITITDVEMTPDLRIARVFFSVFPEEEESMKRVLRGLRSASSEMKREIATRLGLRFTPMLEFRLDQSVAYGSKIESLLREIREGGAAEGAGERRDDGHEADRGDE